MTISAFIFKYTLTKTCAGNKSDLARRLGVTVKEIYRYEKQFKRGGGTAVGMDALFEMYHREKLSLDAALCEYDRKDPEEKAGKCPNILTLVTMRNEFAKGLTADDNGTKYLKSADSFLDMQERMFCGTSRKPGKCKALEQWVEKGQPCDMDWHGCPCANILESVKDAADQLKNENR